MFRTIPHGHAELVSASKRVTLEIADQVRSDVVVSHAELVSASKRVPLEIANRVRNDSVISHAELVSASHKNKARDCGSSP